MNLDPVRPSREVTASRSLRTPVVVRWVWWLIIGAVIGLGVISILTVGALLLVGGLVMGLIATRNTAWSPKPGVATFIGLSVAPFVLAWLNRDGPGTVCHEIGDSAMSCADQYSPWPFFGVGVSLFLVGSIATVAVARSQGE